MKVRQTPRFQTQRFLLIWVVFIFVFFSFSHSKLTPYILPLFPALALLSAPVLWTMPRFLGWILVWATMGLGAACVVCHSLTLRFSDGETSLAAYQQYSYWVLTAGVLLVFTAGMAGVAFWKKKRMLSVLSLATGILCCTQLLLLGHESFVSTHSSYYFVQTLKPYIRQDTVFYAVRYYDQTLPFYLKRPVRFVEYRDEFQFGQLQEPDKWLSVSQFAKAWQNSPPAIAITTPWTYSVLKACGLPMKVIAQSSGRLAVIKPAGSERLDRPHDCQ